MGRVRRFDQVTGVWIRQDGQQVTVPSLLHHSFHLERRKRSGRLRYGNPSSVCRSRQRESACTSLQQGPTSEPTCKPHPPALRHELTSSADSCAGQFWSSSPTISSSGTWSRPTCSETRPQAQQRPPLTNRRGGGKKRWIFRLRALRARLLTSTFRLGSVGMGSSKSRQITWFCSLKRVLCSFLTQKEKSV